MSWRAIGPTMLLLGAVRLAHPQDLPRGAVIDAVATAADATQTYALYLPSGYTPERQWPLLVGFHAGGRGRAIVDTYREAAEQYGVIVAGSNNARNGPWEVSLNAAIGLVQDLGQRLSIDVGRLYLTDHSGGARLALQLAGANPQIAGVIASSAGFPGGRPPASVRVPIFGTAGTEDFNYLEMRRLDRALRSPHRLAIFEGGHTLPPPSVAREALAWLELQAMARGLRPKDDAFIATQWEARARAAAAARDGAATVHLLRAMVEDFRQLRDVAPIEAQAQALSTRKDVRRALDRERDDDEEEAEMVEALTRWRVDPAVPGSGDSRAWKARVAALEAEAADERDPARRARARRLLRLASMMAAGR